MLVRLPSTVIEKLQICYQGVVQCGVFSLRRQLLLGLEALEGGLLLLRVKLDGYSEECPYYICNAY